MPIPDAFAAAYFACCVVVGGAFVCAALVIGLCLFRGEA